MCIRHDTKPQLKFPPELFTLINLNSNFEVDIHQQKSQKSTHANLEPRC